ncbi:hypothetical protein GVAV_002388 [Gurleya vavrai]
MNALYDKLMAKKDNLILQEISFSLGMCLDDIVYALELLDFIKTDKGSYYIKVEERSLRKTRKAKINCFV